MLIVTIRKSDQVVMRKEELAKRSTNTVRTVKYLECQRNHATSVGGYAVDGCREFMASGIEANAAFTCAACGCHRNFHKRQEEPEVVCDCASSSSIGGNRN